ncbi:uncharacterized protein LOC110431725 [Sorghum bicolor]|uniref:uncharacterized protein LOC110431725 n=1 Tax=Sorghum bicolor TaxID=4558 RepID=UPI000B423BDB|nr:uncharacterized protein LOC110431725 [Sorghum bicolor]|eukprot:XP_021306842.1 uncharacterized protein LOC110431725 [Sorghum bicolor]
MSSSSSSSLSPISLGLAFIPVTEKLTRSNYQSWRAQVSSAIQGAQAASFIKPTATPPAEFLVTKGDSDKKDPVPNPDYDVWIAKDQQVLSYLLTSLSKEILGHVNTEVTAAGAWAAIEGLFAAQSRARVIATRMALATASKGSSTIAEYFGKMKGLADEMTSAGKKIEDEELISYILTGLDEAFDPVVSAVAARADPISVGELFTQLVSFEQRMDLRGRGNQSSANMISKGGRGGSSPSRGRGGGGGGRNRGGRGNFGRGNGGRGQGSSFQQGVLCQLCGKEGHTVVRCFKRFDQSYNGPPPKSASSASTASYGVDSNWYMDSGATDHITGDLEKLTVHDKYTGGDQVHAANGTGMEIDSIGHSTLYSPTSSIYLKNILHVPKASKSLISVNKLARDNNAFLEFHPDHFLIKEQKTKRTLHRGRCEGGLYPFTASPNKLGLGVYKPSRSSGIIV